MDEATRKDTCTLAAERTIRDGETVNQYVERRIAQIFLDLGETLASELSDGEAAALPMALFVASETMRAAWRQYMEQADV